MASIIRKVKRKLKKALGGQGQSSSGTGRGARIRNSGITKQNDELAEIDAVALCKEIEDAGGVDPESFLFITLDSCRYDTFANANIPNIKSVGDWYEAESPACFTFPAHMAFFIGMTPGIAASTEPIKNPKAGRIWRMSNAAGGGQRKDYMRVPGRNIVDGFKNLGYYTLGTGAASWFNDKVPTTYPLVCEFEDYLFTHIDAMAQMGYVTSQIKEHKKRKMFVFMNVGETHVPYHHRGAEWSVDDNPCVPFRDDNSREVSQERQQVCLEFLDDKLGPLIKLYQKSGASIVICGDHGDCHGEDGLWAHGFYHEKVLKVPMVYSLRPRD